jgi:hypothetical protein
MTEVSVASFELLFFWREVFMRTKKRTELAMLARPRGFTCAYRERRAATKNTSSPQVAMLYRQATAKAKFKWDHNRESAITQSLEQRLNGAAD